MPSAMWAGEPARKARSAEGKRISIGFADDVIAYELRLGLPKDADVAGRRGTSPSAICAEIPGRKGLADVIKTWSSPKRSYALKNSSCTGIFTKKRLAARTFMPSLQGQASSTAMARSPTTTT